MTLIDLEKTTYKFKDIIWAIGILLFLVGAAYRFETNASKINDKIDALEQKVMYKYELEILKINNRIDLLEAKKYALRKDFKSNLPSKLNLISLNALDSTNKGNRKKDDYPQFCMVIPALPKSQKKKLVYFKQLS